MVLLSSALQTYWVFHHGDVIRKLREGKDWKQEKLAEESGLDKISISRIENGRDAKLSSLTAIARALGLTASQLLALTEAAQREEPKVPGLAVSEPVAAVSHSSRDKPRRGHRSVKRPRARHTA